MDVKREEGSLSSDLIFALYVFRRRRRGER